MLFVTLIKNMIDPALKAICPLHSGGKSHAKLCECSSLGKGMLEYSHCIVLRLGNLHDTISTIHPHDWNHPDCLLYDC